VLVGVSGGLCYGVTALMFGRESGLVTAGLVALAIGLIARSVLYGLGNLHPYYRRRRHQRNRESPH
jgi:hypothetical protein